MSDCVVVYCEYWIYLSLISSFETRTIWKLSITYCQNVSCSDEMCWTENKIEFLFPADSISSAIDTYVKSKMHVPFVRLRVSKMSETEKKKQNTRNVRRKKHTTEWQIESKPKTTGKKNYNINFKLKSLLVIFLLLLSIIIQKTYFDECSKCKSGAWFVRSTVLLVLFRFWFRFMRENVQWLFSLFTIEYGHFIKYTYRALVIFKYCGNGGIQACECACFTETMKQTEEATRTKNAGKKNTKMRCSFLYNINMYDNNNRTPKKKTW